MTEHSALDYILLEEEEGEGIAYNSFSSDGTL